LNTEFDAYYQGIYGSRWEGLRGSLLEPVAATAYTQGLISPYTLDKASVLAALSLRLPPEGMVLDACAAPGGKSLVIASVMGLGVRLLSNELSNERRRRLVNVLDQHLDTEHRSRVTVSGFDAAAQGRKRDDWGRFGGILLDAPCSSERHVIQNKKALETWTPARPRFLAKRQWALLSAAFLLLQRGCSLVYVTCALSPEENDGVALRLLKKYRDEVAVDEGAFSEGEKTQFGRLLLPDASGGMGPMYVARFRKN
jgi:16S rRNA (cytosine1407-C5)-methyltransferase